MSFASSESFATATSSDSSDSSDSSEYSKDFRYEYDKFPISNKNPFVLDGEEYTSTDLLKYITQYYHKDINRLSDMTYYRNAFQNKTGTRKEKIFGLIDIIIDRIGSDFDDLRIYNQALVLMAYIANANYVRSECFRNNWSKVLKPVKGADPNIKHGKYLEKYVEDVSKLYIFKRVRDKYAISVLKCAIESIYPLPIHEVRVKENSPNKYFQNSSVEELEAITGMGSSELQEYMQNGTWTNGVCFRVPHECEIQQLRILRDYPEYENHITDLLQMYSTLTLNALRRTHKALIAEKFKNFRLQYGITFNP